MSYIPEIRSWRGAKRDALFSGLQYQFASPGRPLKQTNKQTSGKKRVIFGTYDFLAPVNFWSIF